MKVQQIESSVRPFNTIAPHIFHETVGDFNFAVKFLGAMERDKNGVLLDLNNQMDDIDEWCKKAFGESNFLIWGNTHCWVFLRDEASLLRFKLRWC